MLFSSISSFFLLFIMIFSGQSSPIIPDYHFSRGKIERHVLESYLSRSITMAEFANSKGFYSDGPYPYKDDDIRMFKNIGAKFIGRYLYRSEEHTSELQSLMRISYAVFCLKKKTNYSSYALFQTLTSNIQLNITSR